jgi:ribokinase
MKPKIVVIGSANTDMVVAVDHLPTAGETVLGGDFIIVRGGKGANQAVAAARLGAEVTFVARLGLDQFGKDSLACYHDEGINLDYIILDNETSSGVALIMVNKAGENMIAVAPGANAKLSPANVLAAETAIQEADCLLLQLEIPLETVEVAAQLASKHNVRVILNPAPATPLSSKLLAKVDTLTPNEAEAAALAGEDAAIPAQDAACVLRSKFNIENIVITMGKDGALIVGHRNEVVPAYHVNPMDTTGAGDAFNGGLAVSLARGDELTGAVRFANAVAALSTTRAGAQSSMPRLDETNAFMKLDHLK